MTGIIGITSPFRMPVQKSKVNIILRMKQEPSKRIFVIIQKVNSVIERTLSVFGFIFARKLR